MSLTLESDAAPGSEDQARANYYALLAKFFFAPADQQLLDAIAASEKGDAGATASDEHRPEDHLVAGSNELEATWRNLLSACARTRSSEVGEEYDLLFVGSGRSDISLYVGAYTARSSIDSKLVALREFLSSHGIERQSGVHEPEDHIAMLLEVMRYLISEQLDSVNEQQTFFQEFLLKGGISLCDAIMEHEQAVFFQHVAAFAKSFLLIEHDAFEM